MRSRATPVSNRPDAKMTPFATPKATKKYSFWTRQKKYRRSKISPFLSRFLCIFGPPCSDFSWNFDPQKITSLNGLFECTRKKYSVKKKIQRRKKNKKIYRRSNFLLFLSRFSIKIGVTRGPRKLQNGASKLR